MLKLFGAVVLAATAAAIHAQELTTCRNPSGFSFYHYAGLVKKAQSGWTDDKTTNGVVTLVKGNDNKFDMLYVDGRAKPISMVQDGADIRLLRLSQDTITLLVYYQGNTTEIYSFFKEADGKNRYTVLTNRTGVDIALPKSSLMAGDCEPIRFDLLK